MASRIAVKSVHIYKMKPRILITTGDPEGIGPEVTYKALKDPRIKRLADFFIIETEDKTGFSAIKKAATILKKREAEAVVTAPVNKSNIAKSGIAFKGHTEYLAEVTETKKYAMMFCGGPLKITLVTRHIPLRKVATAITEENIKDSILLTHSALKKYFKIRRPKIGVSALNPHCGEAGLIGKEETRIIIPAIRALKKRIPCLTGPLPADSIFYMAYRGKIDAVVSMYHDQALGPFKMVAFNNGVNITIGLPFVRTSPDHGTAYDIAGKNIADPGSMKAAIKLAAEMCSRPSLEH